MQSRHAWWAKGYKTLQIIRETSIKYCSKVSLLSAVNNQLFSATSWQRSYKTSYFRQEYNRLEAIKELMIFLYK